ncbi:MAG: hypothetical protein R2857_02820 [Vampirovibrionales bacterium]
MPVAVKGLEDKPVKAADAKPAVTITDKKELVAPHAKEIEALLAEYNDLLDSGTAADLKKPRPSRPKVSNWKPKITSGSLSRTSRAWTRVPKDYADIQKEIADVKKEYLA